MRSTPIVLVALAALAPTAHADSAQPLVTGTFEVIRLRQPDGTTQELPGALVTGATVWARMTFAFDGDHVTVSAAVLSREHGRYRACEAAVTTDVVWSTTGFTVAANVAVSARATDFGTLTPTAFTRDTKGCTAHLDKGTYTVTAGKTLAIERGGGKTVLAPTAETVEQVDWRKHVH